jgi:hypothetical protein
VRVNPSAFERPFLDRGVRPSRRLIRARQAGEVLQKGWSIQFLFGTDERGVYMDYYAAHRMTDDRHVRIRAGEPEEDLPSIVTGYFGSDDLEEERAAREAYFPGNREMYEPRPNVTSAPPLFPAAR